LFVGKQASALDLNTKFPGQRLVKRITTPDRVISARISLKRDDGSITIHNAYTSQHNDDLGVYKGGMRLDLGVTEDEIKCFGFLMAIKCALAGIGFGGAKRGIQVDPRSLSISEKERLIRKFVDTFASTLGPNVDVPAPDAGTGEQDMAWIADQWQKYHGAERGIVTGKPVELGGLEGRKEATGYGMVHAILEAAKDFNINIGQAATVIEGFGNVGSYAALALFKAGATILAVKDHRATIYNPNGLDIEKLFAYAHQNPENREKTVAGFPAAKKINDLWPLKYDLALLCALKGMDPEVAKTTPAKFVAEAVNNEDFQATDRILHDRGIPLLPGELANGGGVTLSFREWTQNNVGQRYSRESNMEFLKETMLTAYHKVYEYAMKNGTTLREASYRIAILRLAMARQMRGVQ
jgi:glutamate dehydrogenase/leucine dehydrogenase